MGGSIVAIIVAIAVCVFSIWRLYASSKHHKNANAIWTEYITDYIKKNNIRGGGDYEFINGPPLHRFIADDEKKIIFIFTSQKENHIPVLPSSSSDIQIIKIPFSDVVGLEIISDSDVVGGIGRSIVGGVIAGGAGAVVGAVTAKKKIKSFKVIIYLSDINKPQLELTLIFLETQKTEARYIKATEFAGNVNAAIKAILSKQGATQPSVNSSSKNTSTEDKSDATILREWKGLLDDGIITQEEFDAKKEQILGH